MSITLEDLSSELQISPSGLRKRIHALGLPVEKGQLPDELTQKSWLTAAASRKIVFHRNAAEIWKDAVSDLGGDYSLMVNFPTDPQLN